MLFTSSSSIVELDHDGRVGCIVQTAIRWMDEGRYFGIQDWTTAAFDLGVDQDWRDGSVDWLSSHVGPGADRDRLFVNGSGQRLGRHLQCGGGCHRMALRRRDGLGEFQPIIPLSKLGAKRIESKRELNVESRLI